MFPRNIHLNTDYWKSDLKESENIRDIGNVWVYTNILLILTSLLRHIEDCYSRLTTTLNHKQKHYWFSLNTNINAVVQEPAAEVFTPFLTKGLTT